VTLLAHMIYALETPLWFYRDNHNHNYVCA